MILTQEITVKVGGKMRKFNVTGTCTFEEDYMVDITNKLIEIKKLVDDKAYFIINRGRQYGKTTTLHQLECFLADEYTVISISFEGIGQMIFGNESKFCHEFLQLIQDALEMSGEDQSEVSKWKNDAVDSFASLSRHIMKICQQSQNQYVLMIDEVDNASNHFVFVDFLSMLRKKFLARKNKKDFTFHSVILAGVYDIRNIKLRMMQAGDHTPTQAETSQYNSPWNIATQFPVDMSFSVDEICGMLESYENDHATGMDIRQIATEIHDYTSGYPVLVSGICKYIDELLDKNWTDTGIRRAVKLILTEGSPLFDSLTKNLTANQALSDLLYNMVIIGTKWSYSPDDEVIKLGVRYGYLDRVNGRTQIANKIFEICLTDYFTIQMRRKKIHQTPDLLINNEGIIENGQLNMETCMEKFAQYFHKHYSEKDAAFIEREGRLLFLMFISPVINGNGFSYIESQSADGKQTDVIVTFKNKQFMIELKIWHSQKRHEQAYDQLLSYMDRFRLTEGYLLTFNFNQNKQPSHQWIQIDEEKKILDVTI